MTELLVSRTLTGLNGLPSAIIHITNPHGGWEQGDGRPGYVEFTIWTDVSVSSSDHGATWSDTQPQDHDIWAARGTVKWDGCVNWRTHPSYMHHGCEAADIAAFGAALLAAYEEAFLLVEYP